MKNPIEFTDKLTDSCGLRRYEVLVTSQNKIQVQRKVSWTESVRESFQKEVTLQMDLQGQV